VVPTTTLLKVSPTTIETAQSVTLTSAVLNHDTGKPLTSGRVKFVLDTPAAQVLGKARIKKGQAVITTSNLTRIGINFVEADFLPDRPHVKASTSGRVMVTVKPLSVTSLLVRPVVVRGHPGEPMSFTVTALLAGKKPATDYTGTVIVTSPTDSNTVLPRHVYTSLGISAPSPLNTGLAAFHHQVYTFTPADHGTHTFTGGVTFGKGGAQEVKVTQLNNARIHGKATFAIS
jgi:hypothetical protein